MRVAFGFKAHSGWAALVVLGARDNRFLIVSRRRIELVEEAWAKQPYHAAEGCEPNEARDVVRRGIDAAHRIAAREMQAAIARARDAGQQVVGCGVLMSAPMPPWTVDEILAVHIRKHTAEGVLFKQALATAARDCGLKVVEIPEKNLDLSRIDKLDKPADPPWGKDQKEAALAALTALQ